MYILFPIFPVVVDEQNLMVPITVRYNKCPIFLSKEALSGKQLSKCVCTDFRKGTVDFSVSRGKNRGKV